MNIDFEKMPAVVFDWLEKFSFEELNHFQQKEVLAYFSAEEYDEIYATVKDLRSTTRPEVETRSSRKETILGHFDQHQSLKKGRGETRRVLVWQAAAVFLMMLSGWLFYQVFDLNKDPGMQQVAVKDTVYVEKEIRAEAEIIHDTVYRYKERQSTSSAVQEESDEIERENPETIGELDITPLIELENIGNNAKGNSMKDDSLLRKFGFVSM